MQVTPLLKIGVQEWFCLPSLPFHEATRWTERHRRPRSLGRGTRALPHDGWALRSEVSPETLKGLFEACGPLNNFPPAAAVYGRLLLLLPGGTHRQGCYFADASRAWPEGTWRRRVAAVPLRLHGDPRRKRKTPLKSARWGQVG